MRRFPADLLAALGFLLLPFSLFWPVTLGNRTLIPADNLFFYEPWASVREQFNALPPETPHNDLPLDLLLENYAWKRFITQSLQAGELPLWNPYLFAGAPFLAAGQHSALYPFSIIFYLLPLPQAYGWFIVSQFFLAGLFAYIFLRALGQSRSAAFAGGLVYEFSLFMIVSVTFPMILAGAVWLPLILACVGWITRQQPALGGRPASLPWVTLGAVALGCQILAGHPEVVYYTLLISGAYSVFNIVSNFFNRALKGAALKGAKDAKNSSKNLSVLRAFAVSSFRPAIYLLAMVGLGLALGAAQLIPLVDVLRDNFRVGSASLAEVRSWAYPPRHFLAFLTPNVFGNPAHHSYFDLFTWQWVPVTKNLLGQSITKIDWGVKNYVEGGAYVGILPLLLSAFGILSAFTRYEIRDTNISRISSRITQPKVFFTLLAFFSLAFAFGTPLYALLYYLPGLNQLHSPFRWVWPFGLCIAVLAGYGLDYLRITHHISRLSFVLRRLSFVVCLLTGLTLLTALLVIRLNFTNLQSPISNLLNDLALAPQAFASAQMFFSYEAVWVAQLAITLIVAGLFFAAGSRLAARPIWGLAAAVIIAIDLLLSGSGFHAAADPAILAYTSPALDFLKRDTGYWRFTTYDPTGRKPFNANVGWFFDLYDVRGYDSIIPKQYANYMSLIEPQGELQYNRIAPISNFQSLDSPLLDLLNVKYVISLADINSPKYKLVYDAEVKVYENLGVAPRAFTLPQGCALAANDFSAAVKTYDPRQALIFESISDPSLPPAPLYSSSQCLAIPADITAYTINEVNLNVGPTEPAYLLLADSYANGWRAFIRPVNASDEQETEVPLYRVNGNFRAVKLDPTASGWTIRFKYSPNAVKFGGFISAIALLSLVVVSGMWLWRYFYRESAEDSTARRIAKNSLAPMALNLMNRGIDLVFAAFMLRLLGPGDAGKYYFAGVLITWFEIWMNFGLNTYLIREVSRDRANANRYLSNSTLLRLGLGVASFPALLLILLGLAAWGSLAPDTGLAIILLAIGLVPASLSTGLTALFYGYEKAEYPAAITTLTTLLKVVFGAIALLLGYSFVGLAAVTILVNTITVIMLLALAIRLFSVPGPRVEVEPALQRAMLRESWPLMLNHLLATLFFKIDVALLQPIRGDVEVGWYSTGYKFIEAFNIIPSLFTFALFPVVSRQANEDRPALLRSYILAVKLLVTAALPLAVCTTFLAPTMIGLLAGQEFLPAGAIALMFMVWSMPVGWINSVTNYVLIALGQQRALTRAFIIGLTFNVIANLIFIPRYGYVAAAVITILSEIVEGLPFYFTLHRTLAPIPWLRMLWRPALSAVIMFAVTWGGWQIYPLLGLAVGGVTYMSLIITLRVFDRDEQAQLLSVLPVKLRDKFALMIKY